MWFLSRAEPHIMVLHGTRGKPGVVQREDGTVVRAMASEARELVCGSSFLPLWLGQVMSPL